VPYALAASMLMASAAEAPAVAIDAIKKSRRSRSSLELSGKMDVLSFTRRYARTWYPHQSAGPQGARQRDRPAELVSR